MKLHKADAFAVRMRLVLPGTEQHNYQTFAVFSTYKEAVDCASDLKKHYLHRDINIKKFITWTVSGQAMVYLKEKGE